LDDVREFIARLGLRVAGTFMKFNMSVITSGRTTT